MQNIGNYYQKCFTLLVYGFAFIFSITAYSSTAQNELDTLDYEIRQLLSKGLDLIPSNTKAAKSHIFLAEEKARNNEKQELLRDAYLAASKCYVQEEKYDSVIYYRELFAEEHYKIYLEKREKFLEEYTELYSDSVYYLKKELLLADAEVQKTQEQTSRVLFVGVITALIIIVLIIVYLFIQRKKKKQVFEKLKHFNNIVTQQRKEILVQSEELNKLNEEIIKQNNVVESHKNDIKITNNQLVKIYKSTDKQNKLLTENLVFAKQIQGSLLPSDAALKRAFSEYFVFHQPRDLVGGDFYWLNNASEYVFIVLADSTGHGVPGAFISVLGKTLLDKIIIDEKISDPADILLRLHNETISTLAAGINNEQLKDFPDDGMDIAICRFSKNFNELIFSGAKRPVSLFVNGELTEIKGDKYSVGSYTRQSRLKQNIRFTNKHIEINNDCLCYLFSDGYTSQMNEKYKKIGIKNFKSLLADIHYKPLKEQKAILEEYFNNHKKDQDQTDDVSVIGIKVKRT